MANIYVTAQRKACLKKHWIESKHGQRDGNRNLINAAFALYYNAYRRASKCPDVNHRVKMLADLASAAKEGWSWPPACKNLYQAFDHLLINGGNWKETDMWWENYWGPQCSGPVIVPIAICNFLRAVDARGAALAGDCKNFERYAKELGAARKIKRWSQIGSALGGVASAAENARPVLWVMSVPRCEVLSEGFERLGSYTGAVGKLWSFLDQYASTLAHNRVTANEAIVTAALSTAISCVPVIGDYFSRAVAMVPGLVQWARNIKAAQNAAMAF